MVDQEVLKLETELEIKNVEDIKNGEYMGTESDVIDRIKRMDNL